LAGWRHTFFGAREQVLSKLEEKRIAGEIAASLDAKVLLSVKDKSSFDFLRQLEPKLRFYFIVSQLLLEHAPNQEVEFDVVVSKADGAKCVRCWNYSACVGSFPDDPELCERCMDALKTL
jgi:isoleucyl-tRNA synthetase